MHAGRCRATNLAAIPNTTPLNPRSPIPIERLTKKGGGGKKLVIQDLMEKHLSKKQLAKIRTWVEYCPADDGLFTDQDVKRLARWARGKVCGEGGCVVTRVS